MLFKQELRTYFANVVLKPRNNTFMSVICTIIFYFKRNFNKFSRITLLNYKHNEIKKVEDDIIFLERLLVPNLLCIVLVSFISDWRHSQPLITALLQMYIVLRTVACYNSSLITINLLHYIFLITLPIYFLSPQSMWHKKSIRRLLS